MIVDHDLKMKIHQIYNDVQKYQLDPKKITADNMTDCCAGKRRIRMGRIGLFIVLIKKNQKREGWTLPSRSWGTASCW
jgi:hypothetical protein